MTKRKMNNQRGGGAILVGSQFVPQTFSLTEMKKSIGQTESSPERPAEPGKWKYKGLRWIGDNRTKNEKSRRAAAAEAEVLNMAMRFSEDSRREIIHNIIPRGFDVDERGRNVQVWGYNWKKADCLISAINKYATAQSVSDNYKVEHLMERIIFLLGEAIQARQAATKAKVKAGAADRGGHDHFTAMIAQLQRAIKEAGGYTIADEDKDEDDDEDEGQAHSRERFKNERKPAAARRGGRKGEKSRKKKTKKNQYKKRRKSRKRSKSRKRRKSRRSRKSRK